MLFLNLNAFYPVMLFSLLMVILLHSVYKVELGLAKGRIHLHVLGEAGPLCVNITSGEDAFNLSSHCLLVDSSRFKGVLVLVILINVSVDGLAMWGESVLAQ